MRRYATIFEGPDCGGKTTAAQYLVNARGGILVHTGPTALGQSAKHLYESTLIWMRNNVKMGHVVFDRFHIGERVYGPIVRGVDTLGEEGQRGVEQMLQQVFDSVLVIFCIPQIDAALEQWRKRRGDEMISDEEKWKRTYERYEKIAWDRSTDLTCRVFNYRSDSLTKVLATVRHDHKLTAAVPGAEGLGL